MREIIDCTLTGKLAIDTANRILIVPDLHAPFTHMDALPFLIEVNNFFKPDKVVFLGDEIDGHSFSFHTDSADTNFLAPDVELEVAIEKLRPFYQMFPEATILESNHGSLIYRKRKWAKIPRQALKSYREILDAPMGWSWTHEYEIELRDGSIVHFMHGSRKNAFAVAKDIGKSHVCGHYHTEFKLVQDIVAGKRLFGMNCGCLIDDKKYAFDYAKNTKPNVKLGCGLIIDTHPMLIPMNLDANGRWIGTI